MPNNYQRLDRPKAIYPVQMSVKLFLFVMTFLSLTGYFLRAPYIYVLFNYDFALNYSDKISMAIADGIYIFAIIIYLPLQLFYLCFYMKEHGFFENWENGTIIKIIFSITLLSNFWQKWLFESLVAHEKLCEKRLESNSTLTCWGHREYHSNHSNMSEAQSEAYHSMVNSSFPS
uniref:Uncharacterized protein n=1 Tax=Panagrolaimus davidi TaxID=227884 RepID=A0A914QXP5_9BILA